MKKTPVYPEETEGRSVDADVLTGREVNFCSCYAVSSTMLVTYLRQVTQYVEVLNLNHCYWLSASCCDTIVRCCHLVSLHLLHLKISMPRLVSMLAHLKHLQHLSVTLHNVREFQSLLDGNPKAQGTMQGMKVLTVQVKTRPVHAERMTMQFLAVTSFFEYCSSLEEFHVQGSVCSKGIPPYVVNPQIRQLQNLKNIHTMTVTDAIDPFARMFFFGALLEMCKLPELRFRTLLQPLVVNEHLARKDSFTSCIHRIEQLQHLDISQTNDAIPNQVYQLERARQLRYLNVADNTLIDSHSLQVLADSCPHLASINLRDCHHLYLKTGKRSKQQVDTSGLQSLVVNCTALRHINISGVHIHARDLSQTSFSSLCHLLTLNTQWESVSLSPCCLCPRSREGHTENTRKRVLPIHNTSALSKRPRYGVQTPNLDVGEEEELSSELGKLVASCPQVQHFELIGAGFRSSFSKRYKPEDMRHFVPCAAASSVGEDDILCIRRWKHLEYLQLSGVPGIRSGQSLAAISAECPKLRRLLLAHLGPVPLGSYEDTLLSRLPSAHRLTDLRIEQCHFHLRETFWQALSGLTSLQRLCILSKSATFTPSLVQRFVQQVPSLVVLQLFVSRSMTLKECSQLQTRLVITHKEQRPALSVCILPLLTAGDSTAPDPRHTPRDADHAVFFRLPHT
ncbi:LOW QUALITY PROTEIN: F-box/LRR-repeat protein 18-like [Babylonia areolata]|uniref:LOW QUALITY PROTEIN: F-box/LRR-repeat protein 18-like n=1 Tax=Babylonia areolata TaxID=304850 RepID=UPI003FD1B8B6